MAFQCGSCGLGSSANCTLSADGRCGGGGESVDRGTVIEKLRNIDWVLSWHWDMKHSPQAMQLILHRREHPKDKMCVTPETTRIERYFQVPDKSQLRVTRRERPTKNTLVRKDLVHRLETLWICPPRIRRLHGDGHGDSFS